MKKLIKVLFYISVFLFFVILFLPKDCLYYALEKELTRKRVVISDERVEDRGIALAIKSGELYINDMNIAHIQRLSFYPLLLANIVTLDRMHISKELPMAKELSIKQGRAFFSFFYPLKIFLWADVTIGRVRGDVDLRRRVVQLYLSGKGWSKVRTLLHLKKVREGLYSYEYHF